MVRKVMKDLLFDQLLDTTDRPIEVEETELVLTGAKNRPPANPGKALLRLTTISTSLHCFNLVRPNPTSVLSPFPPVLTSLPWQLDLPLKISNAQIETNTTSYPDSFVNPEEHFTTWTAECSLLNNQTPSEPKMLILLVVSCGLGVDNGI